MIIFRLVVSITKCGCARQFSKSLAAKIGQVCVYTPLLYHLHLPVRSNSLALHMMRVALNIILSCCSRKIFSLLFAVSPRSFNFRFSQLLIFFLLIFLLLIYLLLIFLLLIFFLMIQLLVFLLLINQLFVHLLVTNLLVTNLLLSNLLVSNIFVTNVLVSNLLFGLLVAVTYFLLLILLRITSCSIFLLLVTGVDILGLQK